MVTKKQLAALAKARAARARKTKARHTSKRTTRKRTRVEFEGEVPPKEGHKNVEVSADLDTGVKHAVLDALKYTWSALKEITVLIFKKGYHVAKARAIAGWNALRGQSERLSYIKYVLANLTAELDKVDKKTTKIKLQKLKKLSEVLVTLTELENEDNKDLSKKFVRDIYAIPNYIDKIIKEKGSESDKTKDTGT